MKKKIKTGYRERLFIVLMVLLSIPLLQSVTHLFKEKSLRGAVETPVNPNLTTEGWFSGSWQPIKEKYLNDAFGFRSFFVRINNQIALSLFREVHAFSVIFGKEDYLFEENYIKAWYGADFIGTDSIRKRVDQLKYIQDRLQVRYNKNLLVVITAGKGSFYPEYFPEHLSYPKGPTNYETYCRLAGESGLRLIDFNSWFLLNKQQAAHSLYPRYGIHWSVYGSALAADSLLRTIEDLRGIDLPSIYWNEISIRKACREDYDMADGLNLLFKLRRDDMAYPELLFEAETGKVKPSVLVVADSFFWGMFNFGISRSFSKTDFWFYNRQIFETPTGKPLSTGEVNFQEQILGHDVIILMATEANLPQFGWGFIDQAWKALKRLEAAETASR